MTTTPPAGANGARLMSRVADCVTPIRLTGEERVMAPSTVKGSGAFTLPRGVVSVRGPEPIMALFGTWVMRLVELAAKTGAEMPLKVIWF